MPGAKIVVLYPPPRDVKAFEEAYRRDHGPMVTPQTFKGLTSRRAENRGSRFCVSSGGPPVVLVAEEETTNF